MQLRYFPLIIFISVFYSLNFAEAKNNSVTLADVQLKNLSGQTVSLNDYSGQITVVNLWATWCTPCIKEMPVMERLNQDFYPQNVKVVGIAVFSDMGKIDEMLRLTKVTYPVFFADKSQIKKFGNLTNIPQTFILDSNGHILERFSGSQSYLKLANFLNKYISNEIISQTTN